MFRDKIGIIAGGGQFPLLCAKEAREKGYEVYVIAHKNETLKEVEELSHHFHWITLGQLGNLIDTLKKWGLKKVIFAGSIEKKRIFRDIFPDFKALSLWKALKNHHDDNILRAVSQELLKEGIEVLPSTLFLENLKMEKGILTKKKPIESEMEDIQFGFDIAKKIGELDIGQCIVVKDRCVLAVECVEGTDKTILRGAELGGEGVIVVKICKPNQDERFDLPSIGLKTIETMILAKAKVLAAEANKTLFFDKDKAVELANKNGIVIVGI